MMVVMLCSTGFILIPDHGYSGHGALNSVDIDIQKDGILITGELEDAFNPELLEALKTGIPVEFYFQIRLLRKRWYWFNKNVDKLKVVHTVSFDTLNKQYQFTLDTGSSSTTRITESLDECIDWMTKLNAILPFDDEIDYGKGQYYIKVVAESKCSAPGTFRTDSKSSEKFTILSERERR